MHIAILGAGPAGLYLAYLIKRRRPETTVTIIEQNPADATFGFGVVFSDRALEFLREDDEATYSAITPHMESWNDITIVHRGERVTIDGVGFSAVGRLKLLQLLQARARSVGIEPIYRRVVKNLSELCDADLIVGADGVNSLVRRGNDKRFGAGVRFLKSLRLVRHRKRFETLTQTFVETDTGSLQRASLPLCAGSQHVHRRGRSGTFARAGFAQMEKNKHGPCVNACLRRRWMVTR